ncbi:uncharacterized protein TRIADDRAFT_53587 [Trichoplax adhaerens]|uniref:Protein-serine/threonine kinase n=1 Tax=Trichoplax adhaerens TaxID=10228 RepID=B3RPL9_TRIAD|nr:hypothetical protein TRIADDRAFT_53587 [Trichoplax adhaerens]EDV28213.1 hypothetical protein TRIADDRAFT_53587 [Trichoplax adhaerens]|eukprot:XP_002110047.1 hypothetical protein TRIADDRAFT_53587 [Trichoplax adhaerens]
MAQQAFKVASQEVTTYINRYWKYSPSPLSIRQLMDFGRTATSQDSYRYLRCELPIRLAHIMKELHHLPNILMEMPSVQTLNGWYSQSLSELIEFREKNADNDSDCMVDKFTDLIHNINQRHSTVIETMAKGIMELKTVVKNHSLDHSSLQYFLDRFYINRTSMRLLITQHLTLFGDEEPFKRHIGCINPNCSVMKIVESAAEDASSLCDQYYMAAPKVEIEEHNAAGNLSPVTICYIPSQLHYMVFELLKNSMRATVEKHIEGYSELPPIKVIITAGKEDIVIRVVDRGGGVPLNKLDVVFSYMYSTAPDPQQSLFDAERSESISPMAGYGYGLPLSRLYARYLNGDLKLSPLEGYGMDAYIYLKRFSVNANEVIPVFSEAATQRYKFGNLSGDWTCPQ